MKVEIGRDDWCTTADVCTAAVSVPAIKIVSCSSTVRLY